MTQPQEKLLPCPFCGAGELLNMTGQVGMGVSCLKEDCAAYMANVPLLKWNTRTPTAELEKDRARLDWLEKSQGCATWDDNDFWSCYTSHGYVSGNNLRQAIDAAMGKETKK